MWVAIMGARDYPGLERLRAYVRALPAGTVVIGGGGAPLVAAEITAVAQRRGLAVISIRLDYAAYGRAAELARDREIVALCERLVVFTPSRWGGVSHDMRYAVWLAREARKSVEIVGP
jgi:hypothetical protein